MTDFDDEAIVHLIIPCHHHFGKQIRLKSAVLDDFQLPQASEVAAYPANLRPDPFHILVLHCNAVMSCAEHIQLAGVSLEESPTGKGAVAAHTNGQEILHDQRLCEQQELRWLVIRHKSPLHLFACNSETRHRCRDGITQISKCGMLSRSELPTTACARGARCPMRCRFRIASGEGGGSRQYGPMPGMTSRRILAGKRAREVRYHDEWRQIR